MIDTEKIRAYIHTFDGLDDKTLWDGWTERDFEKLVLDTLNLSGCYAYKLPDKETDLVLPDLIVHWEDICCDKHTAYIELKKPSGKLSKNQTISFSNLQPYCDVYIINSISKFSEFLKNLLKPMDE